MTRVKARFVAVGVAVAAIVSLSAAWVAGAVGLGPARAEPVSAGAPAQQLYTLKPSDIASGIAVRPDNGAAQSGVAGAPSAPIALSSPQLAAQVRSYLAADASTALPDGASISPDLSSWRLINDKTAVVRIDVFLPDLPAAPLAVVMAEQDGGWKVLGTLTVDESPSPTPTQASPSASQTPTPEPEDAFPTPVPSLPASPSA